MSHMWNRLFKSKSKDARKRNKRSSIDAEINDQSSNLQVKGSAIQINNILFFALIIFNDNDTNEQSQSQPK